MGLPELNTLKPLLDVSKEYYKPTTKIEEIENDDDWCSKLRNNDVQHDYKRNSG